MPTVMNVEINIGSGEGNINKTVPRPEIVPQTINYTSRSRNPVNHIIIVSL
jgi:hypothetical protein